jgi:hypothetical protein
MYWECVPDKVRAVTVQRSQALEARQGQGDGGGDAVLTDEDDEGEIERGWCAKAAETATMSARIRLQPCASHPVRKGLAWICSKHILSNTKTKAHVI